MSNRMAERKSWNPLILQLDRTGRTQYQQVPIVRRSVGKENPINIEHLHLHDQGLNHQ